MGDDRSIVRLREIGREVLSVAEHLASLLAEEGAGSAVQADGVGVGDGEAHAAEAMDAVRRIVRSLRSAEGESESALGISAAQLFVLREVEKGGSPTVGELARRTATAQSSVSEVVTRLATRGLLQRRPSTEDRRRTEVTLTEQGRALLSRAPETVQERMISAFRRLPPARQRLLAEGMSEWVAAAGLAGVTPTMFFEPTSGT